jgi:hypothetical protein
MENANRERLQKEARTCTPMFLTAMNATGLKFRFHQPCGKVPPRERGISGERGFRDTLNCASVLLLGSESRPQSAVGGNRRERFFVNKFNAFVCITRNRKQWPESANFQILSPARVPFRHTGKLELYKA